MNYQLEIWQPNKEPQTPALNDILKDGRQLVMIGRRSEEVYNTIALEDSSVSPFQCCIKVEEDTCLRLFNGQVRTECGKGLRSEYDIPCRHCHGRCMGLHPGRAIHYQRNPENPTLLNAVEIGSEGVVLKEGDVLTVCETKIRIVKTAILSDF